MAEGNKQYSILYAEDSEDDFLLIKDALEETNSEAKLIWVRDGQELLDYLENKGKYTDKSLNKLPDIILLDLKMPVMNGTEALEKIRAQKRFATIPIIVLTTSKSKEDQDKTYKLGANSYIQKPDWYENMVQLMNTINNYWFQVVVLPEKD